MQMLLLQLAATWLVPWTSQIGSIDLKSQPLQDLPFAALRFSPDMLLASAFAIISHHSLCSAGFGTCRVHVPQLHALAQFPRQMEAHRYVLA